MSQLKTPALLLAILLLPMSIAWLISRARSNPFRAETPAAIGLSIIFVFTGIGHFIMTAQMADMLPAWVPARVPLIYATGVLELVVAVMLLIPKTRTPAVWLVILMLIAFFPANVYAAIIRHPMGGGEWGPMYLLIRTPLQLLLIAWAWWFLIRPRRAQAAAA